MKLKYNIAASVAAFILSQSVAAQQRFNEMTYSPNETTFRLNAPNKPSFAFMSQEEVEKPTRR